LKGLLAAVDLGKSFVAAADAGNKQKNVRVVLKRLARIGMVGRYAGFRLALIPVRGYCRPV
jgi:predicted transcriptional regulator